MLKSKIYALNPAKIEKFLDYKTCKMKKRSGSFNLYATDRIEKLRSQFKESAKSNTI